MYIYLLTAAANLLSVTRNISFSARGIRSAAPTIWNSLPSRVRSCRTLTTFRRHLKSHFFPLSFTHRLVTHLNTSDSFSTMVLYTSIYLLVYLLTTITTAVITHANGSHGTKAFIHVCLTVCVSVCFSAQHISKTNDPVVFKLVIGNDLRISYK